MRWVLTDLKILTTAFIASVFIVHSQPLLADSYPGLPTRSQNPLLQSYFIPAAPITSNDTWSTSHSLYITNTYQVDKNATEELIIDVENTRYDFQMTYSHDVWHFNINLSLIDNRGGSLDQGIESWHDIFGLPQSGRDKADTNQLQLFYQKAGEALINSSQPDSGLGDIQLATGYQLSDNSQLWFSIELPSSNSNELLSNDAIDVAFWYSRHTTPSEKLNTYGSFGIALPGDSGLFENRLNTHLWFAQLGMGYAYTSNYHFFVQSDFHTPVVKHSDLDAFDNSFQVQFGLRLPTILDNHQLELFFSEDIFPGHAPDITFGLRLSPGFD